MDSIRDIYKIGLGPSSSHTMGPNKAAQIFSEKNPTAASFRVTLCGSLAATGKGHGTDLAVRRGLAPRSAEILWRPDIVKEYHTNGMLFEALDADGAVTSEWTVFSIGGGDLSEGPWDRSEPHSVYPHGSLTEIGSACVMAAVAVNQLFGGTNAQIEYAAEMAMEHNLGLTCDPVCGLVQIPCIERRPPREDSPRWKSAPSPTNDRM